MALRRAHGFTRYAFSIQYHGGNFLGMAYQGRGENCILPDGTDLRGLRSVEGYIREALTSLVGRINYENFQVSSRTDRGVHALKNTFHVDIRPRKGWWTNTSNGDTNICSAGSSDTDTIIGSSVAEWNAHNLRRGLNYYLRQQCSDGLSTPSLARRKSRRKRRHLSLGTASTSQQVDSRNEWLWSLYRTSVQNSVRIINVVPTPLTAPNKFYNSGDPDCTQPAEIDWNVRFTATSRTYCYRILHMTGNERDAFVPFEHDRAWRIVGDGEPLDIDAMNLAGEVLLGTHDFSSFRGPRCQRSSPIVTLDNISISSYPYSQLENLTRANGLKCDPCDSSPIQLYTIEITGESFVYRQVRNIVGCLVRVGQRKLAPSEVRHILEKRDRRLAPAMAPAHGLFLTNVTHWGLDL